jgi:hypothetical protein
VKAPVVVLNVTPDGRVPEYEYEVGVPVTVGERTCEELENENAPDA